MEKFEDEYTQKFYNEYVEIISNLTNFEKKEIDMESMRKSSNEVKDFDIFKFTYKNKEYILEKGKLKELKK